MNYAYSFIGRIALEFRVSLANLCKIFGKEPTEKEQLDFYEKIKQTVTHADQLEVYKYLFFVETINESPKSSLVAYTAAKNYISRYKKAKESDDLEKVDELKKELHKTDEDFKKLKARIHDNKLTPEDVAIITRYRIRHVVSRETFAKNYELSCEGLRKSEAKLTSNILKEKLAILNEYYLHHQNKKVRKFK